MQRNPSSGNAVLVQGVDRPRRPSPPAQHSPTERKAARAKRNAEKRARRMQAKKKR